MVAKFPFSIVVEKLTIQLPLGTQPFYLTYL
jgi:hypothetical protein